MSGWGGDAEDFGIRAWSRISRNQAQRNCRERRAGDSAWLVAVNCVMSRDHNRDSPLFCSWLRPCLSVESEELALSSLPCQRCLDSAIVSGLAICTHSRKKVDSSGPAQSTVGRNSKHAGLWSVPCPIFQWQYRELVRCKCMMLIIAPSGLLLHIDAMLDVPR